MAVAVCEICGDSPIFTKKGWRHSDKSLLKQRCEKCGWSGGNNIPYKRCPKCGSSEALKDDHYLKVIWIK